MQEGVTAMMEMATCKRGADDMEAAAGKCEAGAASNFDITEAGVIELANHSDSGTSVGADSGHGKDAKDGIRRGRGGRNEIQVV